MPSSLVSLGGRIRTRLRRHLPFSPDCGVKNGIPARTLLLPAMLASISADLYPMISSSFRLLCRAATAKEPLRDGTKCCHQGADKQWCGVAVFVQDKLVAGSRHERHHDTEHYRNGCGLLKISVHASFPFCSKMPLCLSGL